MACEGITEGMTVLLKQMDMFKQICRHKNQTGIDGRVEKVKEWREQIEKWPREMSRGENLYSVN